MPLSDDLERLLVDHLDEWYYFCILAFRRAIDSSGIDLPKGQLSDVLRHTFAAHFIMGGRNIVVLQRILGHTSITMTMTMTMRYAHLSPDHLREAISLNPLADFDTSSTGN